ncbi:MAG TPA: hypothetical protein VIN59_01815, partial [Alphaproteobacteria bacterium]
YYLTGGYYPYCDACVYSLFSDREIGDEVMSFLRDHADTTRWRFSETVLIAENIPAPVGPRRTKAVLVWGSFFAVVAIYMAWHHQFGA